MDLIKKDNLILMGKDIDLKILLVSDLDDYYNAGFSNPDAEVDYYTGTKESFTITQVENYLNNISDDKKRYDFKITNKCGRILGEAVLNDIDNKTNSSHFRIALFNSAIFGKGYGSQALELILSFAFVSLKLHRVELEVYAFNRRGVHLYEKFGFKVEGRKRDAFIIDDKYTDIILMSILENEYFESQK